MINNSGKTELKKIIYFFERRHGYLYDSDMFQMNVFLDRGYSVETWSSVNWTFSDKKLEMPDNADDSGRTIYINNKIQLDKELERVKNEKCIFLFYPYHGYNFVSYVIRKRIKKYGFDFCNITEDPNLGNDISQKMLVDERKRKIILYEFIRTLKEIKSIIFFPVRKVLGRTNTSWPVQIKNLYARKIGPIKYPSNYNFITTNILFNSFPNYNEILSDRNVLIHSSVYDEYLNTKSENQGNEYGEKYVVFIDQFETGHSDFIKIGWNYPILDKESYYQQLDDLFKRIESKTGMKVVIALHPKAEYEKNEFNGRKTIQFQTNKLIHNAELVISGISTCLGNMVLDGVDFLPICSSEYFDNVPEYKIRYNSMENCFGGKALDISNEKEREEWEKYIINHDTMGYKKYRGYYLVSPEGIEGRKFYETVLDYIEQQ